MPLPQDRGTRNQTLLSLIVPCLNEKQVIQETHGSLVATLSSTPAINFPLLYLDDGSRDATLKIPREIRQSDRRVGVIALSGNVGHQVVLTAGLEHARGDAVIVITDVWVTGRTLLFIAILFLGGAQLLFLGIMGECLGRIYGAVKHRPVCLVKERVGFAAANQPTGDVEMAGA